MRAVSAMTICSDDGDVEELEKCYQSDSDDEIEKDTPASTSPVSVVNANTCEASTTFATPSWMVQWAAESNEETDRIIGSNTLSTSDCSTSAVTLDYSCSTNGDNNSQNNHNDEPVYVPSTPIPLTAAASSSGQVFFSSWVAINFDSDWVDNDDALVSETSLRYLQIIVPPADTNKADLLMLHLTTHNDEVEALTMVASKCCVSVQVVSSRIGKCLALSDGVRQLHILPVNVPKSIFSNKSMTKINNKNYEQFFTPFRKTGIQENKCPIYAPDEQQDAVIYLRFSIDLAMNTSYRLGCHPPC
jgi:hypothetical protein